MHNPNYLDERISQDDLLSIIAMGDHAKKAIPDHIAAINEEMTPAIKNLRIRTAWRLEGTLREYPTFEPVNMWFQYPIHKVDEVGSLKDIQPEGDSPSWKGKGKGSGEKKTAAERKIERLQSLEMAYEACSIDEVITVEALAEFMGVTDKTIRRHIKDHKHFDVHEGIVTQKL